MKIRKKIKGFSVVELLIAVIIMGILVAIIIPRLATRTELARQKAALVDLENIQNAMERAAIDTGYYYRLYVLNDTIGGDGFGFGDPDDIIDGVRDEELNTVHNRERELFIDIETGELRVNYDYLYTLLTSNETAFNWNGPYIKSIRKDPWGSDYFFDSDYLINGQDYAVIGSFGPNKVGPNQYDSDDVIIILSAE